MQASVSDQIAISARAFLPSRTQVGTVKAQLGAETLRLYARAWARFAQFCAEHGRRALPCRTRPGRRLPETVRVGAGRIGALCRRDRPPPSCALSARPRKTLTSTRDLRAD
jgi:hypothetical protein